MYAIMFEAENKQLEKEIHLLMEENEFLKCGPFSCNIYRHKSDNMINVHRILNQISTKYKGKVHIFVCKMDDLSDFGKLD